jgi:hypothetical protein
MRFLKAETPQQEQSSRDSDIVADPSDFTITKLDGRVIRPRRALRGNSR